MYYKESISEAYLVDVDAEHTSMFLVSFALIISSQVRPAMIYLQISLILSLFFSFFVRLHFPIEICAFSCQFDAFHEHH